MGRQPLFIPYHRGYALNGCRTGPEIAQWLHNLLEMNVTGNALGQSGTQHRRDHQANMNNATYLHEYISLPIISAGTVIASLAFSAAFLYLSAEATRMWR